jgi:hypothetical protein
MTHDPERFDTRAGDPDAGEGADAGALDAAGEADPHDAATRDGSARRLTPSRLEVERLMSGRDEVVTTRDLTSELPRREASTVTQTELERLHQEFVQVTRRFTPDRPCVDFETFATRVQRQREYVGLRYVTRSLKMSVRVVQGRPVVVVEPLGRRGG